MRWLKKLDDILLALLVVAVADGVLFHFGGYFPLLQPESHSGSVERQARRFAGMVEASPGRSRIVVMGNSKTQASIQESLLEAELAASGLRYQVMNLAVGGTSPRAWYALLENGGASRDNTAIVILGVNSDSLQVYAKEELIDVEVAKTRLRISDALAFAGSYRKVEERFAVFLGAGLRTLLFREDVRQYLASPAERHRQVAASSLLFENQRRDGRRADNRSSDNLLSARLGEDNKLVVDELDEFIKADKGLRRRVERMLRQQGRIARAMARGKKTTWRAELDPGKVRLLRRLVEALNREGIKVVFSVIPLTPYSLDRPPEVDHVDNLFTELKDGGADVEMWVDRELLRRLHSPAYYKDTLHVNAEGANIYTRGLSRFLSSVLDTEAGGR